MSKAPSMSGEPQKKTRTGFAGSLQIKTRRQNIGNREFEAKSLVRWRPCALESVAQSEKEGGRICIERQKFDTLKLKTIPLR
jgi:hypothetical protein